MPFCVYLKHLDMTSPIAAINVILAIVALALIGTTTWTLVVNDQQNGDIGEITRDQLCVAQNASTLYERVGFVEDNCVDPILNDTVNNLEQRIEALEDQQANFVTDITVFLRRTREEVITRGKLTSDPYVVDAGNNNNPFPLEETQPTYFATWNPVDGPPGVQLNLTGGLNYVIGYFAFASRVSVGRGEVRNFLDIVNMTDGSVIETFGFQSIRANSEPYVRTDYIGYEAEEGTSIGLRFTGSFDGTTTVTYNGEQTFFFVTVF